jgi:protein-disulfide isomerase
VSKTVERIVLVLNLVVVGLLLFVLLRRGGAVRTAFEEWRARRNLETAVREAWPSLSVSGQRLDRGVGPVRLIEIADYQCPYCRKQHPILESLLDADSSIGVVLLHMPLSIHPAAPGAARASLCAAAQGRFRAMNKRLYEESQWMSDTNWTREAIASEVPDTSLFHRCLADPATQAALDSQSVLADRLGATGTPTFLSESESASGLVNGQELLKLIASNR